MARYIKNGGVATKVRHKIKGKLPLNRSLPRQRSLILECSGCYGIVCNYVSIGPGNDKCLATQLVFIP